jgi:hypothetical protein
MIGNALAAEAFVNATFALLFASTATVGIAYQANARDVANRQADVIHQLIEASTKVSDAFQKVGGTILTVYSNIMDPKKDFTIKGNACRFVQNQLVSVDDGVPFNQFAIDVMQIISGKTISNSDEITGLKNLSDELTSAKSWGFDTFKWIVSGAVVYVVDTLLFDSLSGDTILSKVIGTINDYASNFSAEEPKSFAQCMNGAIENWTNTANNRCASICE